MKNYKIHCIATRCFFCYKKIKDERRRDREYERKEEEESTDSTTTTLISDDDDNRTGPTHTNHSQYNVRLQFIYIYCLLLW